MNKPSLQEINNIVNARIPLSFIVTHDEQKCIEEIHKSICKDDKGKIIRELFIYSSYMGLIKYSASFFTNPQRATGDLDKTWNPNTALEYIQGYKSSKDTAETIFIFRDFHTVLTPGVARQLKDIYNSLIFKDRESPKLIIGMGGVLGYNRGDIRPGVEPSLEKQMMVVNWDLPSREEIEGFLRVEVQHNQNPNKAIYKDEDFFNFSRGLQGLPVVEIENAIAKCEVEHGKLDLKHLMNQKKQIIARSEILEFIESDTTLDQLGGMDNLKKYIQNNSNSHDEEAIKFGVEPLKGILLIGPPGTGKSEIAKAIGNFWNMPTLRLDIGKVMGSLVGMSEQRMREAIKTAEGVAPDVLYCDEIEKALSGTQSSSHSDGGTLNRVFGTLLTSMQEGMKGVVLVATANNISMLPPELIRRFSETFYVSIPTEDERKDIWKIWLVKKKRNPENFNIDKLAKASEKFTGAEIAKSLSEAIATSFNKNKQEITTESIIEAIKDAKPIAVVMATEIQKIEEWAKTRTRFASSQAEELAKPGNQTIKLGSGDVKVGDLDEPSPGRLGNVGRKKLS